MKPALALSLLCLPAAAHPATLRAQATLAGPMVHIADIWNGAGAAGARTLGPGPAPGGQIMVGAAQLGAIAQAYGVEWQPDSPADQAVLTRLGSPLPLQSVLAALRPALAAQGAGAIDPAFDVAVPFFEPPMLDASATPHLAVDQLSFDPATGRFYAILVVDASGSGIMRLPLSGTVAQSVAVVVPTRRLLPGAIINAEDLTVQRIRASLVTAEIVHDPAQAIGLAPRHVAFPGQPLPVAELEHPICITKGDRLILSLSLPGLSLTAVGEALQDGAQGDAIAVRNPISGSVLTASVTGPDQARIEPGGAGAVGPQHSGFTLAGRAS